MLEILVITMEEYVKEQQVINGWDNVSIPCTDQTLYPKHIKCWHCKTRICIQILGIEMVNIIKDLIPNR